MKGLRDDQRWPNRAVIAAAFLVLIAAVAAVLTLLKT